MAETKETKTAAKATEKDVKQAFINRKLQVLNQKSGAKYERTAARVLENNK